MGATRLIALVAYPVVAAVCGLTSSVVLARMVGEVNAKLAPDERFSPFWWHYGKLQRLLREYRRLYPGGPRAHHFQGLIVIMTVSFIAAAIALLWH